MEKHPCIQKGPPEVPRELLPSAYDLLAALSAEQHHELVLFATRRLRRVACNPQRQHYLARTTAEELVQGAFAAVLLGEEDPQRGRRLKARQRRSPESLVHFLRSLINSHLSTMLRSQEAGVEFCPLSDEQADGANTPTGLERLDLRRTLFRALHEDTADSPRLTRVVDAWERGFLTDDRIASGEADRSAVHEVRLLAREHLRRLASELVSEDPTGRELL